MTTLYLYAPGKMPKFKFNKSKLKQRRKYWNLTLQELADQIQSSKGYIWELENAQRTNPSAEILMKLSHVLKLHPADLMMRKK